MEKQIIYSETMICTTRYIFNRTVTRSLKNWDVRGGLQVIVKHLLSGTRIVLRSQYGLEILKIRIYHDQVLSSTHFITFFMSNDFASYVKDVKYIQRQVSL